MYSNKFGNVSIFSDSGVSDAEIREYINFIEKKYARKLTYLGIRLDGDFVDLDFKFEQIPFERIRRITGYLVGDMSKWNDAKSSEERDRLTHETDNRMEAL